MKATLEVLPGILGTLRVSFRKASEFEWNWHYHSALELTWIQKGTGARLIGDHAADYSPNDLVLVGSNLPHTWASARQKHSKADAHQAVVAHFRAEMFPEALLALPEYEDIAALLPQARRGLHFPAKVARALKPDLLALARERDRFAAWTRLARLLHQLAADKAAEPLASERYQHTRSYRLNTRLERVIAYMETHHDSDTPLDEIARHARLSPSAFSRFFHRMTGKTFVSYRNGCRIREACQLLSDTDDSITEIAYASGFGNLANFNRQFRAHKRMTPRAYRRAYHPLFAGPPSRRAGD